MSIYTKEFLEGEAIKNMVKSGVTKEVQDLFKEKMWNSQYSNMLSEKGLFFIIAFLSDIKFYSTYFNLHNLVIDDIRQKLNEQGFIFYVGKLNGYINGSDDNLFILEPEKEFKEKIALFGGIEEFLSGL